MKSADLLQKIYDSGIGTSIRESGTLFPWIETIHVVAITMVLGTIAIVDLRLLGYASHRRGLKQLTLDMLPFTWVAFVAAVISGAALFTSNATSYWANTPFKVKMVLLVLAGINMAIFHMTAYRTVLQWDEDRRPPAAARISGGLSLVFWLLITIFGRWIGYTL